MMRALSPRCTTVRFLHDIRDCSKKYLEIILRVPGKAHWRAGEVVVAMMKCSGLRY